MVYLDYSLTTPMSYEALDVYNKIAKEYSGSVFSNNRLGDKTKELYKRSLKNIADTFNVMESEITFTTGATEANNLALIGTMMANHKQGSHLIVSKLEHASIYKICNYLEKIGFEVSYVDNDEEGLIDFEHLKSLIRPDTVMVSICALNEELGIRQPLKMIRQIIKKENPNTFLHSDLAQAIGKVTVNLHDVDMASISSHKIFGPAGMGLFYHNELIKIYPLVFGNGVSELVPVTYSLPGIKSFEKALLVSMNDIDKKEHFISRLNDKICNELSKYDNLIINKTKYSIPHILSISLKNLDANIIDKMLSDENIYIKAIHNELNPSVMAVYNDVERSKETLRISLSHKTTTEEINKFLNEFKKIYNKVSLGKE